jgi:hypothetical protein
MDISERLSTALIHSDYLSARPTEYLRDPWLAASALQKLFAGPIPRLRFGPSLFSLPLSLSAFGGGWLSSPWRISGSLTSTL